MKVSKDSYFPFEKKFSRFHTVSASPFFRIFATGRVVYFAKKKRVEKNRYGTVFEFKNLFGLKIWQLFYIKKIVGFKNFFGLKNLGLGVKKSLG